MSIVGVDCEGVDVDRERQTVRGRREEVVDCEKSTKGKSTEGTSTEGTSAEGMSTEGMSTEGNVRGNVDRNVDRNVNGNVNQRRHSFIVQSTCRSEVMSGHHD